MRYNKIKPNDTIGSVIENINKKKINFCVCLDSTNKLLGIFTLGDFRRAIIHKISLNEKVKKILNNKYVFLKKKIIKS